MIRGILSPIIVMFSTYTAIPMPRTQWDSDYARLAIGFLPLAGAVIGVVLYAWSRLCAVLGIGDILFAAVAAVIPIVISGGIHMDGFCDTVDALSSYQPREKRLEILKDPNAGAFAVIWCVVYMLLVFGLFVQSRGMVHVTAFGYVLSRALSALNAVTMPNARSNTGMLAHFTQNAHKRAVIVLCVFFTLASCAGIFITGGFLCGGSAIFITIVVTVQYRYMALKKFGGATGDTAGFFSQAAELAVLAGVTFGSL